MKYYLYNRTRREAIVDFLLFYIPSTSTNKPLNYNKFPPQKKKKFRRKCFCCYITSFILNHFPCFPWPLILLVSS